MRLTNRLLLIIVPTVVLGLLVVFTVTSLLVLSDFQDVETEAEQALLERTESSVLEDLERHDDTVLDWAHWTETYDYLGGDNPDYPQANFAPISYVSYQLSFVVIVDLQGNLLNGTGFDPIAEQFRPLPDELATPEGRAALGLPDLTTDDGHLVGLVTIDGEPHMASSWAILTNEETGPLRGTMVWGSKVTGAYGERLAERRGEQFELIAWEDATPAQMDRLSGRDSVVLSSLIDDETMVGELRMDDVRGQPALLIHHEAPRTIYQHGLNAMTVSFFAAFGVGLAFLAVGLVLVRRFVTAPVAHLSRRVEEIQAGSKDRTLATDGKDEVADLAQSFHDLLASLDDRERRLLEQNRDLDAFAAVVSHDLLSPLSTVNLTAKVLEDDLAKGDLEKGKEHLSRIQRTSKAIEERVHAILTYARAGNTMGAAVPVDLAAVVASVQADLAADLERSKATMTVGPMPRVMGNEQLLKQVVQNLVSNALKYHKPGQTPVIRIDAEQEDGLWRITVADDGVGFDDSEVSQMLTPFKRLERTRATPGHGIGLASCARIMERLGGRLELRGKVGVGGEATLILPAPGPAPATA